ncbi:MAG TPA: hypothetical protein VHS31_11325 [Tepidisphaeraceae bacterium]|nr:hypothetical protein [Tepidisphaeraceae bacterium]
MIKHTVIGRLILILITIGGVTRIGAAPSATTQSASTDIKTAGAFDFPQAQAEVLCDTSDLRVSAWNNAQYLYVQAVIWADTDNSGTTRIPDGRIFGDQSALSIDCDADGKITVGVDRTYYVNPTTRLLGLHYVVAVSKKGTTALQSDSGGRGSIRYLARGNGSRCRIDNYLIPLNEIHRSPGNEVRLVYWAWSVKPKLTLNSLGIPADFVYQLPLEQYHTDQDCSARSR